MSRRTALATALAVVLTVVTASLAVAANLGMFNDDEPVGQLTPVTASGTGGEQTVPTDAATIYVDERGEVLPFAPGSSLDPDAGTVDPSASPARAEDPGAGDDHVERDEDDDHEGDDHEGDDHEDDDHEDGGHEGRDDDD